MDDPCLRRVMAAIEQGYHDDGTVQYRYIARWLHGGAMYLCAMYLYWTVLGDE